MKAARSIAILLAVVTLACGSKEPAAAPTTELAPPASTSAPASSSPAPIGANEPTATPRPALTANTEPTAPTEPAPAPAASASAAAPPASGIPCKTADDCWTAGGRAIKRPAKFRGKQFVPCKDGESAPICKQGVCSTLGFGC